jgi:DNA-binding winged helix-turn-helix (wHTH) protein/TolB-like protein/Flp pilus assembly protein TadD
MAKEPRQLYQFGPYKVDVFDRVLCRDGEIVPLTPKAFDLLLVLVENSGKILTKETLMERVWPDSFVEEANLSHYIYKLREALGQNQNGGKYIETLPRRGYRFVGTVTGALDHGVDLVLEERTKASMVIEDEGTRLPERNAAAIPSSEEVTIARLSGNAAQTKRWLRPFALIGGCVILLGLTVAYLLTRHQAQPAESTEPIRSLAVLPFRPLSAESRDESLELGMADALITKLSNIKQVVVRPTSSILKYSSSDQGLLAAGREQGVDAVVEGKVQKVGNRIRMTVQFLRVSDGSSLWAGTFDDNFTNVFTVQDSISAQVAESLATRLTGEEQKRIAKHYTDNIEAYQLYLKGRLQWYKFSPDGVAKSIDFFSQAIALDPSYALAYAGLSSAYSVQGATGQFPPAQVLPLSRRAAETALKLDDTLAEAHVAAGGKYLLYERDWLNARREFDRAIELNSSQFDAHDLLGYYWEVMEQFDKAEAELKLAQRISPLMALPSADIASLAYIERHYDEALDLYWKAHDLDPDFVPVPFLPGQTLERKGLYEQAITECRQALASSPDDPKILPVLGYAYASAGRTTEAQAILDKLRQMRKRRYVSPFMIALLCVGLDKTDEALDWLNKAFEERDPQLIWVHLDPQFDRLHGDSRFTDLLRRMNVRS